MSRGGAAARWVITCDHASNRVPEDVGGGDLGLPPEDMARHIAYDVGAAGVARALAEALDAPVILSDFSRLVIDPNRGEDDPTLLMKVYDGSIIPANRHADAAEIERRLARYHRPYHAGDRGADRRAHATRCSSPSIPSPAIAGPPAAALACGRALRRRHALALPLLARLNAEPDLCVGDNQPYSGHLPGDALDRHGVQTGLPHVLIEVRNDLIETPDEQPHGAEGSRRCLTRRCGLPRSEAMAKETARWTNRRRPSSKPPRSAASAHLDERKDVQNIDMMNLTGFCRNCLSRWYQEAAAEKGIEMDKEAAREIVYGMPYAEWKAKYQAEASAEQKAAFAKSNPGPERTA
jgi:predicted N-formylglutamate amidohydrolase